MTTSSDKTPNQTKSHADRYDIPTLETGYISSTKDCSEGLKRASLKVMSSPP
jgi:hypothetical protein